LDTRHVEKHAHSTLNGCGGRINRRGSQDISRLYRPIISNANEPISAIDDQFCCDAQQRFRLAVW
jgi:hypothetical protein